MGKTDRSIDQSIDRYQNNVPEELIISIAGGIVRTGIRVLHTFYDIVSAQPNPLFQLLHNQFFYLFCCYTFLLVCNNGKVRYGIVFVCVCVCVWLYVFLQTNKHAHKKKEQSFFAGRLTSLALPFSASVSIYRRQDPKGQRNVYLPNLGTGVIMIGTTTTTTTTVVVVRYGDGIIINNNDNNGGDKVSCSIDQIKSWVSQSQSNSQSSFPFLFVYLSQPTTTTAISVCFDETTTNMIYIFTRRSLASLPAPPVYIQYYSL